MFAPLVVHCEAKPASRSAAVSARNAGAPVPLVGPAKTVSEDAVAVPVPPFATS